MDASNAQIVEVDPIFADPGPERRARLKLRRVPTEAEDGRDGEREGDEELRDYFTLRRPEFESRVGKEACVAGGAADVGGARVDVASSPARYARRHV